ncbi:MAG: phosphatidate cytidylyltransferase [Kiritimatiellia bacterium]
MMPNINKRVYSGMLLAGVLGLAIVKAPISIICAGLLLIVAIAMLEFYAMMRQIGISVYKYLGIFGGLSLIGISFCVYTFNYGVYASEIEVFILLLCLVAIFIRQFLQKLNGTPVSTIACTMLGILYIPFLFNFFTKLGLTWDRTDFFHGTGLSGRLLCFYLIAVVKSSDIGAYLVGSRIGKNKLFPRLSPRKTWEGFLGGMLLGLAVSLLLYLAAHGHFGNKIMTLSDAVILGIVLPIFGLAGDLFESLLKRAAGAKDTGNIIPGMGGLLDVLDSLLMAVPFFYYYVLWFMPTL